MGVRFAPFWRVLLQLVQNGKVAHSDLQELTEPLLAYSVNGSCQNPRRTSGGTPTPIFL